MKKINFTIFIFFLIFIMASCSTNRRQNNRKLFLDFEACELTEKQYKIIEIEVPSNYKLESSVADGFCEYRINYSDKSILYISTDIYRGSRLNYQNLYDKGIDGYSNRKTIMNDTIKNSGKNKDDLYWLEYIYGDVVIGYTNATEIRKVEFDKVLMTLKRK